MMQTIGCNKMAAPFANTICHFSWKLIKCKKQKQQKNCKIHNESKKNDDVDSQVKWTKKN